MSQRRRCKLGSVLRTVAEACWSRTVIPDGGVGITVELGPTLTEPEIIAHVALNVLTNYVNRVAGTEVDFPRVRLLSAA